MTVEFIKALTFGIYQLKQARSYVEDFVDENGNYQFEVIQEENNLIRVKIKSRFVNNCLHNVFIQYNAKKSRKPIEGYYCDCKVGARMLGTCAHVTSVLHFFGVARCNIDLIKPSITNDFIRFCYDANEEIDSESETDDSDIDEN